MSAYLTKYNIGLDGKGYLISQKGGIRYYQKKRAPLFVNKFGSGDSSYRDATFWQFFVQTNWRNGAKQLKFDDPGKFWKSSDVDTTILEQLTLSKVFQSAGQLTSGVKVNAMEAWRSSVSWWNASYGYRQQLTITAPAAVAIPVGYPVQVTIDTAALETAVKVRSDRKDWRIIYNNGTSDTELFRDYVSTTSTFFATQTTIASGASDSNYYVYYGYSSESTSKQPSADTEWNSVYGFFGTVPDANSVAIYHFDEGSGTSVADATTNTYTGTLVNTPSWGTDGKFGRYVTFTGASSQRMDLSNLSLGSSTLEGWFYITTPSTGQALASQSADGGGATAWLLQINSSKLQWLQNGGTTVSGTTTLSANTWYHLAVTNDGSTTKLYVNGAQDGSGSNSAPTAASDGYHLAARHEASYSSFYTGRMQHVRFSNTARASFAYVLSSEPSVSSGSEVTTQPPSSSFDLYAGSSAGKIYKWDGATTWTEQFDASRILWYDNITLEDTNKIIGDTGGTETAQSQGFQLSYAQTIKGAQMYLKKSAGTPNNISVRIETNNAGVPSGTLANANATATITALTSGTYAWTEVTFASTFQLSASTTYHLVLKSAAASNDNNHSWGVDGSSPTFSSGAMSASTDGGTTWSAVSASDAMFRLLGNATSVNCMLLTSVGGTQRLYVGTGDPTGQVNGDARLFSYDGTNWALTYAFAVSTEAMINSIVEYSAASKVFVGVGPQAKVYASSDMSAFTISKDINVPQNPGYVYTMKEYNRVLHVGGGSPEFLPAQYYNGFLNIYDTTAWNILYPFDFTVIKSLEFYDAYLFMGTYHGHLYVYDTSTLNPLFNFKDQYAFKVSIQAMKYFDDKLYMALYPQSGSNETNVGVWLFDRRGLTLAYTISGVTGYRCFAVVNGNLFVGTGDDGYIYQLSPTVYNTTGWAQSSYYDANLPSVPKLYNDITLRYDPLATGQSIDLYYKFKESDSWTSLGTADIVGSTETTLSFTTGTTSKKISLKYVLNTTDTSASPVLTEVVMQYALYPTRKWQWTMKIKATQALRLLDGSTEPRSAEGIRQDIENLLGTEQLYVYVDQNGEVFNVLVHDVDTSSWVINSSTVSEEEIALTLLQQ